MCTGNQSQHYGQAVWEFFQSVGRKHPSEVVPEEIILWRDKLRSRKKSGATGGLPAVCRPFLLRVPEGGGGRAAQPGLDKTGIALACEQLRDCIGNRVRRLCLVVSEAR